MYGDKEIEIPQKYKDALQTMLNTMESETGEMYQFTVNKFGCYSNYNCVIGNFNKRPHKIEIYNMDPNYQLLEGVYDDKEAVRKQIKILKGSESFYDFKDYTNQNGYTFTIGKCKSCHSYNENISNTSPNNIDGICQNPQCKGSARFSIWNGVQLDHFTDDIYQSGGGSISICHTKGKWRYVK